MITLEQLAMINGCVAGIQSSYSEKHVVDDGFLNRYNKDGLRFTVRNENGERILSVFRSPFEWSNSFDKILEINLGHVVPENQPVGPNSNAATEVEFEMRKVA